jgi:hypothetical protein
VYIHTYIYIYFTGDNPSQMVKYNHDYSDSDSDAFITPPKSVTVNKSSSIAGPLPKESIQQKSGEKPFILEDCFSDTSEDDMSVSGIIDSHVIDLCISPKAPKFRSVLPFKTVGTPFVLKCPPNQNVSIETKKIHSSNRDFFGFNRDSDSDFEINRHSDVEVILPSPAPALCIDRKPMPRVYSNDSFHSFHATDDSDSDVEIILASPASALCLVRDPIHRVKSDDSFHSFHATDDSDSDVVVMSCRTNSSSSSSSRFVEVPSVNNGSVVNETIRKSSVDVYRRKSPINKKHPL